MDRGSGGRRSRRRPRPPARRCRRHRRTPRPRHRPVAPVGLLARRRNGFAGCSYATGGLPGQGTHGSGSPHDLRSVLIAAGPASGAGSPRTCPRAASTSPPPSSRSSVWPRTLPSTAASSQRRCGTARHRGPPPRTRSSTWSSAACGREVCSRGSRSSGLARPPTCRVWRPAEPDTRIAGGPSPCRFRRQTETCRRTVGLTASGKDCLFRRGAVVGPRSRADHRQPEHTRAVCEPPRHKSIVGHGNLGGPARGGSGNRSRRTGGLLMMIPRRGRWMRLKP